VLAEQLTVIFTPFMGVEVLFPSSQEASEEKLSLTKLCFPFSVSKQAFQRLKKFQQNNGA